MDSQNFRSTADCQKRSPIATDGDRDSKPSTEQRVKQQQWNHRPSPATGCCQAHHRKRKERKKRKPKVVLKGETFEDPDPYQLAVRKTNYGKRKEKLKFVGEQFHDPDPLGLAIRKTSATSATSRSTVSDREVFHQYRSQHAETHPGTVFFDYVKCTAASCYFSAMSDPECEDKRGSVGSDSDRLTTRKAALAQTLAVGVKNVLLLGYGMTLGFPTIVIPAIQGGDGRQPALEKDVILSKEQISWLSSINLICVPLGSIFSGALAQPIGRRRAMQLINIPIFVAWMLFHYASDVSFLYWGLALAGLSGGLGEAPVLTYVAEITQPRYRGMLAATGSTCVILGVLLEFLMGSFLKWRTVALVSSVVPVLAALLLFLIPESPVWLASKGRLEESKVALAWLRGWVSPEQVGAEGRSVQFKEIEQQMTKDVALQKGFTIVDKARLYTRRAFLQPFGIILLCFFIGHFSGMTTLQTYAVQIFHTLKAPINKYYATCLLGLTELIGTLFCVFLVHRTGKRPLVFLSTIGCAVCFFGAATYTYFLNDIPGAAVHNVVANVSSIKADITVIPLRSREVIAELSNSSVLPLHLETQLNATTAMGQPNRSDSAAAADGIVYSAQSFTNYYVNDSLNEPINVTISYGEYVKSAIPDQVFVPLPHVNKNRFVWVPLSLLLGSAFLTHIGIRLVPWILIGEMFAPNVRAGGSGLAGGIAYIFGFLANKSFLSMLATFTLPGTFWIYSLVTLVGAAILYKVLPETEGKSLQEIETYFISPARGVASMAVAPRPGPKLSDASIQLQSLPPPIPPKPYPLKDDVDRARRISSVPRQLSQLSRNTTVSDFSVASPSVPSSPELSRSSSRTSYNLENAHDRPNRTGSPHALFRKLSESALPSQQPPVGVPTPPRQRSKNASHTGNNRCVERNHSVGSKPVFKTGMPNVERALPPHKTQPMTRPVRARGKRPPPSRAFDVQSWDGNKKFEEFLRHHQDTQAAVPAREARPIRHVTSAHDLKTCESGPGASSMLKERKIFNSSTKLTPAIVINDEASSGGVAQGGTRNPAFHLSSSDDESTDM
ncbi:proton myo-inositol cotransporter-like [Anopheles bellator]|uniref:proton myo-inositol cotransporter-like n=1 Tax=Anopheles bellator TaxID=139047 RepID=UPI002647F40F|nr:proton myo-inositol cotransporter-like [Anopheles bellator]